MYYLYIMKHIYQIDGVIQPYMWGGHFFLADLTNRPTPTSEPEAELWMGAHPKGPARVHLPGGKVESLNLFLDKHGTEILGQKISRTFHGQLPFLFKVLDVQQMLSIQAHPDKKQAETGFAKEEKAGIPPSAFNRVFRDDNHKPELSVALSDFYLLHGFLPEEQIAKRIGNIPEWSLLAKKLQAGLADLYAYTMRLPQSEVDRLLQPLAKRLQQSADLPKDQPDYWARQAIEQYTRPDGSIDRGIFSIYFMHIVHLAPGEAIFQKAGVLHAYLGGQVVEIMANSDNVMRGGLTVKHIDVDALLQHIIFAGADPYRVEGVDTGSAAATMYPAPVKDFSLKKIDLDEQQSTYQRLAGAPSIFLVMEGEISISGTNLTFTRGQQFLVGATEVVNLTKAGKSGQLFEATVPFEV